MVYKSSILMCGPHSSYTEFTLIKFVNMNLKTPQLDESYSRASKFCLVLRDIDASHAVNAGNY